MKPLQGLRVVELARVLAGPWSGQLLADLGAEVIKVERPGGGDDTREWGPPFVTDADGASLGAAYYHSCNRGKRSVAIDIASAAGQAEVRALLADADVVIENYKVGGLVKYGLDPARLRAYAITPGEISTALAAANAARRAERLYEVRYRAGAVALKPWLDAQEKRRSAEIALAENRLNRLVNHATLYQALGGT